MSTTRPAPSPDYTSLDTEHFLSFMFGKQSTHGLANGLLDEGTWRKYRRKVLRELRKYIDANVVCTDALHQQRIGIALRKIEEAEGIGEPLLREQAFVTGLVELCLTLLGTMPNHWDRRVVNKAHHRRLDRQRTLTYAQSPEQRAHLIFDACRSGFLPGMDRHAAPEVWDRYWAGVRQKDPAGFVRWFRKTYPEKFASLVG
jgi:hypothetical protein